MPGWLRASGSIPRHRLRKRRENALSGTFCPARQLRWSFSNERPVDHRRPLGLPGMFLVGRPDYGTILEAQSDGVMVITAFAAVNDLSAHADLVQQGSDLGDFTGLPGMAGNHARPVGAHVLRVGQLRSGCAQGVNRRQIHNHRNREPLLHCLANTTEDLAGKPDRCWVTAAGGCALTVQLAPIIRSTMVSMGRVARQSKGDPETPSGKLPTRATTAGRRTPRMFDLAGGPVSAGFIDGGRRKLRRCCNPAREPLS